VRRLEDGDVLAVVRAGRHAEPADQPRADVGHDVAVEVREHEHVVFLGVLHDLHAHVVDDLVLELDVGVLGRDLACGVEPEPVGVLHDVRLVHGRDLRAAGFARVSEGKLDDLPRAGDRDRLDRDPGVAVGQAAAVRLDPRDQLDRVLAALLVLDSGVEILRVLADDHEVDLVIERADPGIELARTHLRVEVERLAQADVDRPEASADRCRDRAFQRHAVAPDRLQRRLGQRVAAVLIHHVGSCRHYVPLELDAGRLEHAARRLRQFRTGAVARDECDSVRHGPAIVRFDPRSAEVPNSNELMEAVWVPFRE
jgi:hypothetical protein